MNKQATTMENICGSCKAMGNPPPCKGHKKGSGGGGSSGGENTAFDTNKKDRLSNTSLSITDASAKTAAASQLHDKAAWIYSQLSSDRTIEYEVGLLSIHGDRLGRNLIIRGKLGLSQDELDTSQEFLHEVNAEFDEFKSQFVEQGISVKNFTAVINSNELTIHIPNPKDYDAFIRHLKSTNLLPIPNVDKQEQKEKHEARSEAYNQDKKHPSPFGDISKGPKPKG